MFATGTERTRAPILRAGLQSMADWPWNAAEDGVPARPARVMKRLYAAAGEVRRVRTH